MNDIVEAQHKLVLLAVRECTDVIRDHALMSGMHAGHFAMEASDLLAFSLIQTWVSADRALAAEKLLHIHADRVRKLLKSYAKDNPR